MANKNIKPYHIAWAVDYLNKMLDAFEDPDLDKNPAIRQCRIDVDSTKYEQAIYYLYELAYDLGIVDEVKEAMREDGIDTYYFNEAEDEFRR